MTESKIGCGRPVEHQPHGIDLTSTSNVVFCGGTVPPTRLKHFPRTMEVTVADGTEQGYQTEVNLDPADEWKTSGGLRIHSLAVRRYAQRAIDTAQAAGALREVDAQEPPEAPLPTIEAVGAIVTAVAAQPQQ